MEENNDQIVYIRESDFSAPKDGYTAYVNHWWCYVEGRGLMFYRVARKMKYLSPQCNSDKDVATIVRDKLYPWADLRFVPVLYLPQELTVTSLGIEA